MFRRRILRHFSKFNSVESRRPISKFKNGIHIMVYLHCFNYYILHKKIEKFSYVNDFPRICLEIFVYSGLIHLFLENFKF